MCTTLPYKNGSHVINNGPNFKIQRVLETGEQATCVPEVNSGVLDIKEHKGPCKKMSKIKGICLLEI